MRLRLALVVVLAVALVAGGAVAAAAIDGAPRPEMVWKPIPFGAKRKRQMAAYSERHYGERAWELTDPQVVVQHHTAGTSFDSAWSYFAANGRHLGEKPGVCAQFVIDTDGTIYQLVNLGIRCRHAIGIEHVGTSAGDILHDGPMIRASLRLTVWLMARYGISWGNVIGHAEILQSPYHHELYEDWRCSTHADWNRREMRTYRRKLKRTARRLDVPIGDGPEWVDSGC